MLEVFKKYGFKKINKYVPTKNCLIVDVDGDYNDGDYFSMVSEFEGNEEIEKILTLLKLVKKAKGRIEDIVFSDDEDELEELLSEITPFVDNCEAHTIEFTMEYYDNDGVRYTIE